MFQHRIALLVSASMLCACGSSSTSDDNPEPAQTDKAGSANKHTNAPADLGFVPKDASTVLRLNMGAFVQSFYWTNGIGPKIEAFAKEVDGCDTSLITGLTDLVVVSRRTPDAKEGSDWEARFSTAVERSEIFRCLKAAAPLFNIFTIHKRDDGFEIQDLSGTQLAWVRWTKSGVYAGKGDIKGTKGPATAIYDRLNEIKTDSPFWIASITDPLQVTKVLDDGSSRGHQMWLELRSSDNQIAIRGGLQYADSATAKKQKNDVVDAMAKVAQKKGLPVDLTELKKALITSAEGRWVLFHGDWTHSQLQKVLEKIQQSP